MRRESAHTAAPRTTGAVSSSSVSLDKAMKAAADSRLAAMARDGYSLLHFLIMAGIVCAAVTLKYGFEHVGSPLGTHARLFAIAGAGLYGGGTVLAFLRVSGRLLIPRLVLTIIVMGALAIPTRVTGLTGLLTSLVAIVVVGVIEHRTLRLGPN
jgi:low temperature requirement protein LtrA